MIPIFWTTWFWSFTLQKCSKRGPLKSGGWHWSLSALRWAKKRPFLKIFDKFFFIFQKSIFLAKFTRWETKKSQEKNVFLLENTPVYLKQSERQKKQTLNQSFYFTLYFDTWKCAISPVWWIKIINFEEKLNSVCVLLKKWLILKRKFW